MHFFIAAVFQNEFDGNDSLLFQQEYDSIKDKYGFLSSRSYALVSMFIIGYGLKAIWLATLKYREIVQKRHLLQKVVGVARRKVKRLMSAGLRFSKKREGYRNAAELEEEPQNDMDTTLFGVVDDATYDDVNDLHHHEDMTTSRLSQQSTPSAYSHHAVLSALYRPDLPQQQQHSNTTTNNSSPKMAGRSSHNRIVISKSSGARASTSSNDSDMRL
jgi:hypothetical protein